MQDATSAKWHGKSLTGAPAEPPESPRDTRVAHGTTEGGGVASIHGKKSLDIPGELPDLRWDILISLPAEGAP